MTLVKGKKWLVKHSNRYKRCNRLPWIIQRIVSGRYTSSFNFVLDNGEKRQGLKKYGMIRLQTSFTLCWHLILHYRWWRNDEEKSMRSLDGAWGLTSQCKKHESILSLLSSMDIFMWTIQTRNDISEIIINTFDVIKILNEKITKTILIHLETQMPKRCYGPTKKDATCR